MFPIFSRLSIFVFLSTTLFAAMDQNRLISAQKKFVSNGTQQTRLLDCTGLVYDIQKIIAQYLENQWVETGAILLPETQKKPFTLSPDGKYIAMPTKCGIEIWDATRLNHVIVSTRNPIESVIFSPDSKKIIYYDYQDIVLYDFTNHTEKTIITLAQIHALGLGRVRNFAFSSDFNYCALVGNERILLVDITQSIGMPIMEMRSGSQIKFSPNNQLFVIYNEFRGALYDITKKQKLKDFVLEEGSYSFPENLNVCFSTDNAYIAYNSSKSDMRICNLKTGLSQQWNPNSRNPFTLIKFLSSKPTCILIKQAHNKDRWEHPQKPSELLIWDSSHATVTDYSFLLREKLEQLEVSENDILLAQRCEYQDANYRQLQKIYIAKNSEHALMQSVQPLSEIAPATYTMPEVHHIDKRLAIARLFNQLLPSDAIKIMCEYLESFDLIGAIPRARFEREIKLSPKGRYIATYNSNHVSIKLWNISDKQFFKEIISPIAKPIEAIKFSPNEKYIVINHGSLVILYDLIQDKSIVMCEIASPAKFEKIKFSSNQKLILIQQNQRIYIYDIEKCRYDCLKIDCSKIYDFALAKRHEYAQDCADLRLCIQNAAGDNCITTLLLDTLKYENTFYIDQNLSRGSFSRNGETFSGFLEHQLDNEKIGVLKIWNAKSGKQSYTQLFKNMQPELGLSQYVSRVMFRSPTECIKRYTDLPSKKYSFPIDLKQKNLDDLQVSGNDSYAICCALSDKQEAIIEIKQNLGELISKLKMAYEEKLNKIVNTVAHYYVTDAEKEIAVKKLKKYFQEGVNQNDIGRSLIVCAIRYDHCDIVPLLIRAHADVNKIVDGISPLTFACTRLGRRIGVEKIISLLLKHQANINYRVGLVVDDEHSEFRGATALIIASRLKFTNVVKLLLAHGADKTIRDLSGKTAADYANATDDAELKKLFKDDTCSLQ